MESNQTPPTVDYSISERDDRHFTDLVSIELGTEIPGTRDSASRHWLRRPPRDLFGIALSGGGIRSATFNLGVLQGLADDGLVQLADYLSTVSGGGYVGGFWTAWLNSTADKARHDARQPRQVQFPAPDAGSGERETPGVRHLREFSRFLSPELGVFSIDTGRMFIAALNAIVPSLLIASSALIVFAALMGLLFSLTTLLPAHWVAQCGGAESQRWFPAIVVTCSTLLLMSVMRVSLVRQRALMEQTDDLVGVPRWPTMIILSSLAGGIALLLAGSHAAEVHAHDLIQLVRDTVVTSSECHAEQHATAVLSWQRAISALLFALYPAGALLAVVGLIALVRAFLHTQSASRQLTIELDTVASWMLVGAGFWTALGVAWALAIAAVPLLYRSVGALTGAGLVGLASRVTWVIARRDQSSGTGSGKWKRLMLAAVWYVILAIALIAAFAFVASWRLTTSTIGPFAFVVCLTFTLIGIYLLDPNYLGLHRFYRSRIARAYLGAARRSSRERPITTERDSDDIHLRDLLPGTPVHLVCCAANDLAPSVPMVNLSRGAGSAVLSAAGFSVGRHWYAWKEHALKKGDRDLTPTLASALTASGAAFNTHMGRFSNEFGRASTFILSALGLRLGLWLPHPRKWRTGVKRAGSGALWRDALGMSSTSADAVFLSDGGHFENTALYELIRRHCRWILVCDAGGDPEVQFNDLGNAIRRIRSDFAVEIRVDLTPLRRGEAGRSKQHSVVGDIFYPDGDTGVIVVLKPTLTGDEPPDVQNYAANHPEFPQQSTADQFFDEPQWESYRRLGQHAIRSTLWPLLSQESSAFLPPKTLTGIDKVRQRFSDLRRHWFTSSSARTDFGARAADIFTDLNIALADESVSALASQIRAEAALDVDTGRDPRAYGAVPRSQQLASVSLLRQALTRFEQLYNEGNLTSAWSAPQNLGLMNGMARWMRAPFTRAWWPILQSQSGQAFREFVAARFGAILSPEAVRLETIEREAKADPNVVVMFASRASDFDEEWQRAVLRLSEEEVSISKAERRRAYVNAPIVEAARLTFKLQTIPYGIGQRTFMFWRSEHLEVPASLWGTGLGTAMLRELQEHSPYKAYWQYALVPQPLHTLFEERKRHADTMQLYASGGFVPVDVVQDPDAQRALDAVSTDLRTWLVMRRVPK
jgi:hypothetical protein